MKDHIKLGTLPTEGTPRDAVHVAVIPVAAGETLDPGQPVGVKDMIATCQEPWVGIIDPFLKAPVKSAQLCYLLLYPDTVTGVRHDWDHPAFPSKTPLSEGEKRAIEALQDAVEQEDLFCCESEVTDFMYGILNDLKKGR